MPYYRHRQDKEPSVPQIKEVKKADKMYKIISGSPSW